MPWKRADYADVRPQMQPGDVIAFSGKAHVPEIIKWATCSNVSHVGVIFQSRLLIEGERQHQIMESTLLNGFLGVVISHLDDRLESYEGNVWWLPLSDSVRRKMDLEKFQTFLLEQEGKPYDVAQAIKSALDTHEEHPLLGRMTYNIEDFSQLFCSELVAAALEASGAISHLNASEVTPIDLCRFSIYKPDYHQLKGEKELIEGYNTLAPEGWGE